jgi:hypothetical protein
VQEWSLSIKKQHMMLFIDIMQHMVYSYYLTESTVHGGGFSSNLARYLSERQLALRP